MVYYTPDYICSLISTQHMHVQPTGTFIGVVLHMQMNRLEPASFLSIRTNRKHIFWLNDSTIQTQISPHSKRFEPAHAHAAAEEGEEASFTRAHGEGVE